MSRRLAVTHAGGPLAEALLEQFQESGMQPDSLVLLDREDRVGKRIAYGDTYLPVEDQHDFDYEDLAGVLLLEADAELVDLLQHADCPVLSHLSLVEQAPLFGGAHGSLPEQGFVKLPSAELATVLPALQALDRRAGLQALHLVSIVSAMHLGQTGVDDLAAQTIGLLNSRDIDAGVFPQPLAFNLIPASSSCWPRPSTAWPLPWPFACDRNWIPARPKATSGKPVFVSVTRRSARAATVSREATAGWPCCSSLGRTGRGCSSGWSPTRSKTALYAFIGKPLKFC